MKKDTPLGDRADKKRSETRADFNMMRNTKVMKPPQGLQTASAVYKFLCYRLAQQNTFWSFIVDAPHFRYGGSFTFDKDMQDKALAIRVAIEDFEGAMENRMKTLKGEKPCPEKR